MVADGSVLAHANSNSYVEFWLSDKRNADTVKV